LGAVVALAGQAMLVAGAAIILIALGWTAPRALHIGRRLPRLERTVRSASVDVTALLNLLASQRAELRALLAPWRRIWRLAHHPLVQETLRWYRRRRRLGA